MKLKYATHKLYPVAPFRWKMSFSVFSRSFSVIDHGSVTLFTQSCRFGAFYRWIHICPLIYCSQYDENFISSKVWQLPSKNFKPTVVLPLAIPRYFLSLGWGGGGSLGVILVRVCEPVFQNLAHSYTRPSKKRTHSYT